MKVNITCDLSGEAREKMKSKLSFVKENSQLFYLVSLCRKEKYILLTFSYLALIMAGFIV